MERLKHWFDETVIPVWSLRLVMSLRYSTTSTALCGARTVAQLDGLVDTLSHLPSPEQLAAARRTQARI